MADCDFEIFVRVGNKLFRMEVFKIYEGHALEKFKVVGGSRSIILQSNRPFLKDKGLRENIDWKLLDGDITEGDPKAAADALNKIIIEIEYRIKD